jgi:hypothetical protein
MFDLALRSLDPSRCGAPFKSPVDYLGGSQSGDTDPLGLECVRAAPPRLPPPRYTRRRHGSAGEEKTEPGQIDRAAVASRLAGQAPAPPCAADNDPPPGRIELSTLVVIIIPVTCKRHPHSPTCPRVSNLWQSADLESESVAVDTSLSLPVNYVHDRDSSLNSGFPGGSRHRLGKRCNPMFIEITFSPTVINGPPLQVSHDTKR